METDLRPASMLTDAQSAVSWGAIAAGAVGAAALTLVLIAFGAGLGLPFGMGTKPDGAM